MSPWANSVMFTSASGKLSNNGATNGKQDVSLVIALKNDTKIRSGDGTLTNPYIIATQ